MRLDRTAAGRLDRTAAGRLDRTSSMPCKRKMSAEEQAAKLHQRAVEIQTNAVIAQIQAILKVRRELAPSTLQHLFSLGAPRTLSGLSCAGSSSSGEQPQQQQQQQQTPQAANLMLTNGTTHEASPCGMPVSEPSETTVSTPPSKHARYSVLTAIPRCYQTVGSVPPHYHMHLLSKCEPSALSIAALGALRQPKSKHVPKDAIVQLTEFLTGWRANDELRGELLVTDSWVSCAMELNVLRNRPARNMVLPVQWAEVGVYKATVVTLEPLTIRVSSRVNDKIVDMLADFCSCVKDPSKLVVQKNYSEMDAVLCDDGGFGRVMLGMLFCTTGSATGMAALAKKVTKDDEETPSTESAGDGADEDAASAKGSGANTDGEGVPIVPNTASELGVVPPAPTE